MTEHADPALLAELALTGRSSPGTGPAAAPAGACGSAADPGAPAAAPGAPAAVTPATPSGTDALAPAADAAASHTAELRAAERHAEHCARCADTLAALRRIVRAARSLPPDDGVAAPPPALWESIAAELGLTAGVTRGSRLRDRLRRTGPVEPVPARSAEPSPDRSAEPVPPEDAVPKDAVPPTAAPGRAQPEPVAAEPVPAGPGSPGIPPGDSAR